MDSDDSTYFVRTFKDQVKLTRKGWAVRLESQILNEGRAGKTLYLNLFVTSWIGTPERMEKLMKDCRQLGYVPVPNDQQSYANNHPYAIFRLMGVYNDR